LNNLIVKNELQISAQSLAQTFEQAGMVLIERLMTSSQIEDARKGVNWALAQPPERYQWIRQRSYEWFNTHPVFVDLIQHPLILEFAETVMGSNFHLIAAQCSRNTKADPYIPKAMIIHRDREFFPKKGTPPSGIPWYNYSFSAMWYLQDTPLEMGPTQLIPGSHKHDQFVNDDALKPSQLFSRAIPVGSVLLFSNHILHRGRFNQVDQPRDLINNVYARPEINKAQLKHPALNSEQFYGPDDVYVPCEPLIKEGNAKLKMLLAPP
jgi:hypothetical protein